MDDAADDVLRFQGAVGHGKQTDAAIPEIQDLYHKFVNEEYMEFIDADPTDAAHKLQEAMDLIWVTIGYCNSRGWDVSGAWNCLRESNMSKLQVDSVTGELKRRADGKILKPEGWKKPDFSPFVNGVK